MSFSGCGSIWRDTTEKSRRCLLASPRRCRRATPSSSGIISHRPIGKIRSKIGRRAPRDAKEMLEALGPLPHRVESQEGSVRGHGAVNDCDGLVPCYTFISLFFFIVCRRHLALGNFMQRIAPSRYSTAQPNAGNTSTITILAVKCKHVARGEHSSRPRNCRAPRHHKRWRKGPAPEMETFTGLLYRSPRYTRGWDST